MESVMQQIKRKGTLSVYNVLKNIRGQRMKMVQTEVSCTLYYVHYQACWHLPTVVTYCKRAVCGYLQAQYIYVHL